MNTTYLTHLYYKRCLNTYSAFPTLNKLIQKIQPKRSKMSKYDAQLVAQVSTNSAVSGFHMFEVGIQLDEKRILFMSRAGYNCDRNYRFSMLQPNFDPRFSGVPEVPDITATAIGVVKTGRNALVFDNRISRSRYINTMISLDILAPIMNMDHDNENLPFILTMLLFDKFKVGAINSPKAFASQLNSYK